MTSDDAKQIVAWDVRRDRDEELGPFQPGRMYSPNFTRYVVIDAENKHWLVKSCADDAHLCSVPLPIDSLPNTYPHWSPNGRYFAWWDHSAAKERIVDVETGKEVARGGIDDTYAPLICWLPDSGRLLLRATSYQYVGDEPTLRVVDIAEGESKRYRITHHYHRDTPPHGKWRYDGPQLHANIVWSPDGRQLLSSGWGLRTWDVNSGQFGEFVLGYDPSLNVTAWPTPDSIVGVGGSHSSFHIWNFNLRTKLLKKSEHLGMQHASSGDGKQIIFVDTADRQKLRVVNSMDGAVLRELRIAEPLFGEVWFAASVDGNLLATTHRNDPNLNVWNLKDGSLVQTINAVDLFGKDTTGSWHVGAFSEDSTRLVVTYSGGKTILWDLQMKALITTIPTEDRWGECDWLGSERFGIAQKNGIKWFDRDGMLLFHWEDESNGYNSLCISPDKTRVACTLGTYTGDWEARPFIQIRDPKDGHVFSTHCVLPSEHAYDLPLSFGPTGHWSGPEELRDLLSYVVVTDDGQRSVFSPDEFERQFGWQNDPNQVVLTIGEPIKSSTIARPSF